MRQASVRDLAEFGLPLVAPDDPSYSSLLRDIENRPQPFGSWPMGETDRAAVLLNQSGKAIVVLAYVWRYTMADGGTRTGRFSNLGSSTQLEVLAGRTKAARDLGSFILPGSKRLITERGMFGNNLDVLPQDAFRGGGCGSSSGGGGARVRTGEEFAAVELCLDVAIFEDGLCAGPDESGLFERITQGLERWRGTAEEIVAALGEGASEGRVFDMLLPLARPARPGRHQTATFANMAIQRLINTSRAELVAWFESAAQPPSLRLHRPLRPE